jgi:hypothetical protein
VWTDQERIKEAFVQKYPKVEVELVKRGTCTTSCWPASWPARARPTCRTWSTAASRCTRPPARWWT